LIDKGANFGESYVPNKTKTEEAKIMIPKYELKDKDVHHTAMTNVKKHLSLNSNGYECDTEMLINVLFKAATENVSIETACNDLENVIGGNTIREYLNDQLDVCHLREQECEMNRALAEGVPDEVYQHKIEAAFDFHDEPFYGKTPELRTYACRGKAKKGTTHFFRIASAYVIWRQLRLTLAVTYVLPEDTALDVLKRLLFRLKGLNLLLSVLYLDKGFCSTATIRYLTDEKQPAILACPIRGKNGGTRALCTGRKSYRTTYTFTDGTSAEMVLKITFVPGKDRKLRKKWLAFIIIHLDWSPKKVYKRYRRRFGIECSYRMLRQVRVITTSKNSALRFFLLGFSLLLVNIWSRLRWLFARIPGPGPRRVDPVRFRFKRFVSFLRHSVEDFYGVVLSISTNLLPEIVIY
jgi:putative transposase